MIFLILVDRCLKVGGSLTVILKCQSGGVGFQRFASVSWETGPNTWHQ